MLKLVPYFLTCIVDYLIMFIPKKNSLHYSTVTKRVSDVDITLPLLHAKLTTPTKPRPLVTFRRLHCDIDKWIKHTIRQSLLTVILLHRINN